MSPETIMRPEEFVATWGTVYQERLRLGVRPEPAPGCSVGTVFELKNITSVVMFRIVTGSPSTMDALVNLRDGRWVMMSLCIPETEPPSSRILVAQHRASVLCAICRDRLPVVRVPTTITIPLSRCADEACVERAGRQVRVYPCAIEADVAIETMLQSPQHRMRSPSHLVAWARGAMIAMGGSGDGDIEAWNAAARDAGIQGDPPIWDELGWDTTEQVIRAVFDSLKRRAP